jgi:carboxymethylenebutenolidase
MGGGFAAMLAPGDRYQAAAVNYGTVPGDGETFLRGACPIVASYGAKDRTLRGAGSKPAAALTANDVAHDVVTYPDAGHGFLNDHDPDEVPWPVTILARRSATEYHEPSAEDARRRIVSFFRTHLAGEVSQGRQSEPRGPVGMQPSSK